MIKRAVLAVAALGAAIGATRASTAANLATILLPEEQEIQMALDAGPEHLRAAATVYVFGKDGYRKVRSGSNGFTCLVNRDGNQENDQDLKPTCWDPEGSRTIVPVMLRVGELIARFASAQEIERDIDAGFASGRFSSPRKAGIAYMLNGDIRFDPQTGKATDRFVPPHYMIYAPGVTSADIGTEGVKLQDSRSKFALPRVTTGYSGGTRTAYIIVLAAPNQAHGH
jgi:hypothetical protein